MVFHKEKKVMRCEKKQRILDEKDGNNFMGVIGSV